MILDRYFEEIPIPVAEIARQAGISSQTLARMDDGKPVQRYTAVAVAKVLSKFLGRDVSLQELEKQGVKIARRKGAREVRESHRRAKRSSSYLERFGWTC